MNRFYKTINTAVAVLVSAALAGVIVYGAGEATSQTLPWQSSLLPQSAPVTHPWSDARQASGGQGTQDALNRAHECGWFDGVLTEPLSLEPNDPISRAQLARVLHQYERSSCNAGNTTTTTRPWVSVPVPSTTTTVPPLTVSFNGSGGDPVVFYNSDIGKWELEVDVSAGGVAEVEYQTVWQHPTAADRAYTDTHNTGGLLYLFSYSPVWQPGGEWTVKSWRVRTHSTGRARSSPWLSLDTGLVFYGPAPDRTRGG